MARLLFGVTGGIAAYKALEAVRLATKAGHAVRVIQTPTSEQFVGRASFEAITGAPVLTSEFEPDPARGSYPGEPLPERAPISHLALVERAEVYLIAPATANTIAKLAHGLADNLLTSAALAATCPVVIAPAMNNWMYLHPATQQNIHILAQSRGHDHRTRRGRSRLSRRARRRSPRRAPAPPRHDRAAPHPAEPHRAQRPGHRRRHPGADRQRPLHRQPLVRADGLRARPGSGETRRDGHAYRRQRIAAHAAGTRRSSRSRRRPTCRPRATPSSTTATCC